MDPKDFDNILKQKLESLSNDSAPFSDWSRMERELEVDSQKDQIFDEQVKRKLEQLSVSKYASSNWSMLYQVVNNRIQRKRAVLISKATELAFLGLFFFAIGQLGWFDSYKDEVYFADSFEKAEQQQNPSTFDGSQQNIASSAIESPENIALNKVQIQRSNIASASEISSNSNIATASLANNTITSRENIIVGELSRKAIESIASLNSESVEIELFEDAEILSLEKSKVAISSLEKLNVLPFDQSDFVSLGSDQGLASAIILEEGARKARVFADAGFDLSYASIESALRMSNSRNATKTQEVTNKLYPVAFLNAGVEFNKVVINSGVEFQSIAYAPNVSHLSGEVSRTVTVTDIDELKYDIISVPLNVAWKVLSYKTWDLSLNTGIVGNLIARTNYSIKQEKINGDRVTAIAPDDVDISVLPPLPTGYFDEPQNTPRISSLLSGPQNYVQSRTGIQVSKKLTRNTSIIANMNYNYQLPLLKSAVQDGINSYTIGLSVRRYFS